MKKTIFVAAMALCLLAGTSVFAQDARSAHPDQPREKMTVEQMARKRTDRMTEALKLNDKQSKQVYEYTVEQMKQMRAQRAEMTQQRNAHKQQMKAILTPEQYTQWEQLQGRGMKQGRAGMRGKSCEKSCCDKPCKQHCNNAMGDKPSKRGRK